MSAWWEAISTALVEAVYPELCTLCGTHLGLMPSGEIVPGLRPWDRPHCCRSCFVELRSGGVIRTRRGAYDVLAGSATNADLVQLVSSWKYHGIRGLTWPLADLLQPVLPALADQVLFVPVPLHASRRRERGFNQAGLLADMLAERSGHPIEHGVLRRVRATPQQAKLDGREEDIRRLNVADSFVACPAPPIGKPVVLVDDLVTSGATMLEAARTLESAGWQVDALMAVGVSSS